MAEPTSTAAGGIAAWKLAGGLALFAGLGAFLASVVTMCMMTPRSPREWAVGLISTVVSSLAGGAYAILKLGLHTNLPADPVSLYLTIVAGLGVVFVCGLPGWALVRWTFSAIEKRRDKDLLEVVAEAKGVVRP